MSVFYVYILETTAKNGKTTFYTGYTNNLLRRIKEHKSGQGAKYCRGKEKIELRYFETYMDRSAAMKREMEIKSFSKARKKELTKKMSKN
ncbi:MAG: GIY-YIG nuclease family protein [Promethearchaeia archaeon]